MDLVARRDGYVEGVGTWIGEDRNHSFVRLLAAHKANGSDVALITPNIDFPKTWKKWVCTCHLQESITQCCTTMVMQTWYQLKAEELLLASTYDLGYDYVDLRNSWTFELRLPFFRNTLYITFFLRFYLQDWSKCGHVTKDGCPIKVRSPEMWGSIHYDAQAWVDQCRLDAHV